MGWGDAGDGGLWKRRWRGGSGGSRVCGGAACGLRRGTGPGTPLGNPGDLELLAESGPESGRPRDVVGCRSRTGAKNRAANPFDPRKSYRTRLAAFCSCYRAPDCGRHSRWPLWMGRLARAGGAFALLHQPTRQHGRGVLFEPGIEQLRDLLAEIGSMAQTRKFVTLQGKLRDADKRNSQGGWVCNSRDLQGEKLLRLQV